MASPDPAIAEVSGVMVVIKLSVSPFPLPSRIIIYEWVRYCSCTQVPGALASWHTRLEDSGCSDIPLLL